MTEVIEQIGIAWSLRERSTKVVNCFGKLTSLDLCYSQGLLRTDFLEMWYGFRSVALCQESVAEKLVRDRQIGAQLQRSFEWANRLHFQWQPAPQPPSPNRSRAPSPRRLA